MPISEADIPFSGENAITIDGEVARKVIILDVDQTEPSYLWGLASVVFAMSIGYWLVVVGPRKDGDNRHRCSAG